jgi:hypothetical protein
MFVTFLFIFFLISKKFKLYYTQKILFFSLKNFRHIHKKQAILLIF